MGRSSIKDKDDDFRLFYIVYWIVVLISLGFWFTSEYYMQLNIVGTSQNAGTIWYTRIIATITAIYAFSGYLLVRNHVVNVAACGGWVIIVAVSQLTISCYALAISNYIQPESPSEMMDFTIKSIKETGKYPSWLEYAQRNFNCCGIYGYTDYPAIFFLALGKDPSKLQNIIQAVPPSCCRNHKISDLPTHEYRFDINRPCGVKMKSRYNSAEKLQNDSKTWAQRYDELRGRVRPTGRTRPVTQVSCNNFTSGSTYQTNLTICSKIEEKCTKYDLENETCSTKPPVPINREPFPLGDWLPHVSCFFNECGCYNEIRSNERNWYIWTNMTFYVFNMIFAAIMIIAYVRDYKVIKELKILEILKNEHDIEPETHYYNILNEERIQKVKSAMSMKSKDGIYGEVNKKGKFYCGKESNEFFEPKMSSSEEVTEAEKDLYIIRLRRAQLLKFNMKPRSRSVDSIPSNISKLTVKQFGEEEHLKRHVSVTTIQAKFTKLRTLYHLPPALFGQFQLPEPPGKEDLLKEVSMETISSSSPSVPSAMYLKEGNNLICLLSDSSLNIPKYPKWPSKNRSNPELKVLFKHSLLQNSNDSVV